MPRTAPATRADIDRLEKRIDGCATKEDLQRFATKEDLQRFATKEDLERFATKEDLERFATKDDLGRLAAAMKVGFDEVHHKFEVFENRMLTMEDRLMAGLARAVNAAHEQLRDYLRAYSDETRAIVDRVDRLQQRVNDHVADNAIHTARRTRR